MAIRRIGQVMVDLGFISEEQLEMLLDEQQQRPGELLGQIAMSMGLITDEQLAQALGEQMGMEVITLSDMVIPAEVLGYITEPMAQLYRIIPVSFEDDTLTVAMCDPQKLSTIDELRSFLGMNIRPVVATEREILKALDRYYAVGGESVETLIAGMEQDEELLRAVQKLEKAGTLDLTSVEALADSAPVRKLLNMVLLLAIKEHASDVHFEPFENEFKIRIRSDGVLYEMVPPPRHLAFAITTRIKVMADLDIAERRLPQDGRIRLTVGGHPRQRTADDVRRERGDPHPRPLGGDARSEHDRHGPPYLVGLPRGDPQAQRHRAGDRADRFGQNDHAVRCLE